MEAHVPVVIVGPDPKMDGWMCLVLVSGALGIGSSLHLNIMGTLGSIDPGKKGAYCPAHPL